MEKIRIRDKYPGSATLLITLMVRMMFYLDHILKLSLLAPGVVGELLGSLDEHRPLGLRLQRVHGTREDGNLINKHIKKNKE
jgi:hypothetical protein